MTLIPWSRASWPGRDVLATLWAMMEESGQAGRFFYAQDCEGQEHIRGDLIEFVQYCTTPGRTLLVAMLHWSMFGMIWIDRIPGQSYGLMNIWYRRKHAKPAQAATKMAMRYGFEVMKLHTLRGMTPYREAVRHALACGWKKVATLPRFVTINSRERPLYVVEAHHGALS